MTISQLAAFAPQFPWDAMLKAGNINPNGPSGERVLVVAEKSAFPKLAQIFADTPVSVWRDLIQQHYPSSGWIRLGHDTVTTLNAYKSARGLLGLDDAVTDLLAQAREEVR